MTQKTINAVNALRAVFGNTAFTKDDIFGISMSTLRKNNLISPAMRVVDRTYTISADAYFDMVENEDYVGNDTCGYHYDDNTGVCTVYVYKYVYTLL